RPAGRGRPDGPGAADADRAPGAALPGMRAGRRHLVNGALVAAFDDLCDPRFGIVPELVERPPTLGAPEWFHATARTCNPAALGGMRGPFAASAAGTRRDA